MHEASLAGPLLRLVLEECERHSKEQSKTLAVTTVKLRVGALMPLESPALQGIFSLMAEGTPAEGATLAVEPQPMTGRCQDCAALGHESEVSTTDRNFRCPCCGGEQVAWQGGNELYIASVTVQEKR